MKWVGEMRENEMGGEIRENEMEKTERERENERMSWVGSSVH